MKQKRIEMAVALNKGDLKTEIAMAKYDLLKWLIIKLI